MTTHLRFHLLIMPVLATGFLVACAGDRGAPTFGSRLLIEGGEVAAIGRKWSDGEAKIDRGQELIEDGRDDVEDGEDLISDGRKKIRQGESLVADGKKMQREAEEAYDKRN